MNYIPGFSNYLRTSVPRYASGGEVMDDMAFSDYGLGGPMLGAETVGFDLANPLLGGPEQGGSYTGGVGGGPSRTAEERAASILDVNPYVAPSEVTNLDPITSQRNGNQPGYYFANELGLPARYGDVGSPQPADPGTFDPNAQYNAPMPGFVPVDPDATYRLVEGGADGNVVYAGAGGEGLRNVFEQANQLTMDDPKNAYWGVEVLDPATGQFERVAENQGPNGLGIVGDIAGVALPVAAAIATGGASLGVQIAAGAAAGGLGGFLAGNDPLKSALISGVTAGLGNVTGFNEAVGGALSDAGNAITTALTPQAAAQAAAQAAGGDIVVTGLGSLAKGLGAGALQGAASGLTNSFSDITGYQPPAEKFAEQPLPEAQPTTVQPIDAAVDPIIVTGDRLASGSGLPFGAAFPVPVEAILNGTLTPSVQQTPPVEQPVTPEPEEIVVTADVNKPLDALGGIAAPIATEFLPTGALPSQQPVTPPAPEPTVEEILVEARKPYTPDVPASGLAPEILRLIGEPPVEEPSILVTGREKPAIPPEAVAAVPAVGALTAITGGAPSSNVVNGVDQATGDIVVKATPKSVLPPPPIVGVENGVANNN